MCYRLLTPLILAVLSAVSSHADQPEAFSVRGVTGLPESVKIELAESGEPFWYIQETTGMSLGEVVQSVCGTQGPMTDAFLASRARELNHAPSLDWKVEAGTAIAVPFCLKIENNVPVTIKTGDTVEGILKEHYGVYGPETVRATYMLNRGEHPDFENFYENLEPGDTLIIPHASTARTYMPSDYTTAESRSLQEIIESLDYATLSAPWMGNVFEVEYPPKDKIEFEYVRFVSARAVHGVENCALAEGEVRGAPNFDSALLLARLSAEAIVMGTTVQQLRSGVVGIIDSGIRRGGDDFFPEDYLLANLKEKNGNEGEDNDDPKNGHIDDVYGINFNTNTGRIALYPTDPDRDHGTKIASLVLGGKEFLNGWPSTAKPLVRLKIVNFSSSRPGETTVKAVHLPTAIKYLDEQRVNVINMSLLNGQRIAGVRNAIEKADDALFVVAAGNSLDGPGWDITHTNAFPARHGGHIGDHKRRVVTVGAHDRTGGWAKFSHYSVGFVDLLAPGCALEVRGINNSFEFENGTSVATAVVSFAAALLSALEVRNPQSIKNRLLAGVDVDPRLRKRAWTSGRLNIVKAISLSHDVIELTADGEPLKFGRIVDRSGLRRFCGDEDKRTNLLMNLVKVRPNVIGSEGASSIQYWKKTDGLLSRVSCPQIMSDESIGDFKVDGIVVPGPSLSAIRDIVLASRD